MTQETALLLMFAIGGLPAIVLWIYLEYDAIKNPDARAKYYIEEEMYKQVEKNLLSLLRGL